MANNWTIDDAIKLRGALGSKVIEELRNRKPKRYEGEKFEGKALNAERRDGYDEAIDNLLAMTEERPRNERQEFIAPEKD